METVDYYSKIISDLRKDIKEDLNKNIGHNPIYYLDRARKNLKDRVSWRQRSVWHTPSKDDKKEFSRCWAELETKISEQIPKLIKAASARHMIKEINAVSAAAVVEAAMKEAGLKYQFTAQTYRAKIAVGLGAKSKIIFYVNYKKIYEELPGKIEAIKDLQRTFFLLGKEAGAYKLAWGDEL